MGIEDQTKETAVSFRPKGERRETWVEQVGEAPELLVLVRHGRAREADAEGRHFHQPRDALVHDAARVRHAVELVHDERGEPFWCACVVRREIK